MIEELRSDVTTTREDGTRGRLRYDYGDHRDSQAAITWHVQVRAADESDRFGGEVAAADQPFVAGFAIGT